MKNAFRLLTLTISFLMGFTLPAQILRSKITSPSGLPVEDAYVINKNSGAHTHSNAAGLCEIPAQSGDSIWIRHLAHQDAVFMVNQKMLTDLQVVVLPEQPIELREVVVNAAPQLISDIAKVDLAVNPVLSAQDILRRVPGLVIGQHAGGGKAEQLFLRGFDLDHGTDIRLGVEGLPVNMVSHAHGQGYADLHFVIPELVDHIEYGKGPYNANQGNLANAAFVDFKLRKHLPHNQIGLEAGSFNTWRGLAMFKMPGLESKRFGYVAGEYLYSDGPFESPQHFNRYNLLGRYTWLTGKKSSLTATVAQFGSRWNASGQIPQRAVDRGSISRFGSIDPNEGGKTHRQNLWLEHQYIFNPRSWTRTRLFYSHYDFELYSNFTFFLRDPLRGDQIRQKEKRQLFGGETAWYREGLKTTWQHGAGWRSDLVRDNELSYTVSRSETVRSIALGQVREHNFYLYGQAEFKHHRWTLTPGWRLDQFNFDYVDQLSGRDPHASQIILSPKLNLNYQWHTRWNAYLHSGMGFHSNDTRTLLTEDRPDLLPRSLGADAGVQGKLNDKLFVHPALWYLFLEDELVYVGDEGIVESAGKTARLGADLSLRYQWNEAWYFDQDFTYAYGRALDADPEADRIPLAPVFTLTNGLTWQSSRGISASLRSRYLSDRPANEDNSIVAKGYFLMYLAINYARPHVKLGLSVENIFNQAWNETQFATLSRLAGEIDAVEEIHFIPGNPRNLRLKASWLF